MTQEIRDRSVNADLPDLSEVADQLERRVNQAVTDNQGHRVSTDQWANVDHRECLVFRELRDTGDCPALTARREPRDNKVSPETSESPDPWVSPVQWVRVVRAESADASGHQVRRVFAAAMDFPDREDRQVPSDPRVPPESPANPAPRVIKDNKDPKAAVAFKVHVERTVCPDLPENRVFKVLPVWMAPTEKKVPEETWASKERRDSPAPEDLPVLPATLEWADPRVSRDNLEFLDFAV